MVSHQPPIDDVITQVRLFIKSRRPRLIAEVDALGPHDTIWERVDSLLVVELVGHLEKIYGVTVPALDFTPENLSTLEQIEALIKRLRHP